MRSLFRSLTPALALAVSFGLAAPSLAQFRPPPLTEAQRLTYQGDDFQVDATKLLKEGKKQEAEEKFRKAVDVYQQALTQDPEAVAAAAGLGAAANFLNDYARTAQVLAPVNQAHPDDVDVAFHLGIAYYKLKRYEEAVPLLEKVSPAEKPEHLLGHYYLGYYYLHQQRGSAAVSELNRYLKLRPAELASKDSEIFQLMGHAYLLLRRPDYARTAFERAQRGLPESIPIQMGLVACLEMENKAKDAVALLDGVISRNPKAPEPRERLGRLLLTSGDLRRAESVANDLVRLQATATAQLLLGDVKLAQKQGSAAEAALRKALQITPGYLPAQLSLAKALQLQGKSDEAIALLEGAAKAGADTVDVWAVLGSVNRRAGRVQRAIEMHRHVLELAPNQPIGHVLLGADHFATGQWDQAIEDYEAARKLDPIAADVKHWLSLALQHRARARADANRLDESVPDLLRAMDLEPTALTARNLGAVLLAQKSYRDARIKLEQAATLPGHGWREQEMLGYALLGLEEGPAAVTAFEKALALTQEPEDQAEIYAGWALAKLEVGEFDSALQRLTESGGSKQATKVAQANLPTALLRRALSRVRGGDAAAAAKDLEQARKLMGPRDTDLQPLANFVRVLVDAEEGRYGEAAVAAKKALAGNPHWALPNAKALVDAYIAYRQGRFGDARRVAAQLGRKADPRQAEWMAQLVRAVNRREAERAYAAGSMAVAEKALKAAAAAEPKNPFVLHNQACLQYRKGKAGEDAAVATWLKVEGQVPEADLNLGIDAQEKKKDPRKAVAYYRKYVAAGGPYAGRAREWKERLQSIYGLTDAVAAGSDEVNP